MALYKHGKFFTQTNDAAFETMHTPGTPAPHPGIYRCANCGDEIAIASGHILPPENHRQHNPIYGEVAWQLTVYPVRPE